MSDFVTLASPLQLLNAQTTASTGNGGILLLRGACEGVTIAVTSTGTTSGGTLSIEEAPYYDPDSNLVYSGTWSVIQSLTASTFSGGAAVVVHVTGSFWAVRCRIATDITGGGSVSAYGWGN